MGNNTIKHVTDFRKFTWSVLRNVDVLKNDIRIVIADVLVSKHVHSRNAGTSPGIFTEQTVLN